MEEFDFDEQTKKAFSAVALAHAKALPEHYLQELFLRQSKTKVDCGTVGSLHDGMSIETWASVHLSESDLPFNSLLGFCKDALQIGQVNAQPVYFGQRAGMYFWAKGPAAQHVLDLWLTSPYYPPGW